jgi:hypothetical protein
LAHCPLKIPEEKSTGASLNSQQRFFASATARCVTGDKKRKPGDELPALRAV